MIRVRAKKVKDCRVCRIWADDILVIYRRAINLGQSVNFLVLIKSGTAYNLEQSHTGKDNEREKKMCTPTKILFVDS